MNKRDEAKNLSFEYERQRQIEMVAASAKYKAEKKLSEVGRNLEPDPECNHAATRYYNNVELCSFCYTGKYKWLDI